METQELIKLAAIFGLVVFLLNLSPAIKRNTKKLGKLKHIKMKKYKIWKGQRKRVKS